MIKKTFFFFWSLKKQFAKYFIVGISGVIIDISSLIFLKEIFGMTPVAAVIANQAVVLIFIFLLNKYWSFRNRSASCRQIARFLILASFNYLFAIGAMYLLNRVLGFDYRLVRIASIAAMVSWNFFVYKYWVYAENKQAG